MATGVTTVVPVPVPVPVLVLVLVLPVVVESLLPPPQAVSVMRVAVEMAMQKLCLNNMLGFLVLIV